MPQDSVVTRCSCGSTIQASERLAGKQVRCPRCARSVSIPQATEAVTSPLMLPTTTPPPLKNRETSRRLLAGAILILLLFIAGLMLFQWFRTTQPGGDVTHAGGTGFASEAGDLPIAKETKPTTLSANRREGAQPEDTPVDAESTSIEPSESPGLLPQDALPAALFEGKIDPEADLALAPSTSTHNTITGLTPTLGGIGIEGTLALICDVSGSMQEDLHPLISELLNKFDEDTPLILVVGCDFTGNGSSIPHRIAYAEIKRRINIRVAQLLSQHEQVYYCEDTLSAISFAARDLKRDTIMFNNDMQDGGSEQALDVLKQLRQSVRFTLSGRSVEHDAPERLKQFIRLTGGTFILATIGRSASPAKSWSKY